MSHEVRYAWLVLLYEVGEVEEHALAEAVLKEVLQWDDVEEAKCVAEEG